jgi:flagellar biosynthesis protein FlhB
MEQSSQDRNLPASDRKLKKARDDGQVARSRDLGHLAVLGTGAVSLMGLAPFMFEKLRHLLGRQLTFDATFLTQPDSALSRLSEMVAAGLAGCAVFGAIIMLVAMLSSVATGGWVMSIKPITPDFSRVNPLSGLGRMFTKDKLTDVAKMSFIAATIIALGTAYLNSGLQSLAVLVLQPSNSAIAFLTNWLTVGVGLLLLVILIVAVIDVPLQGFLHKSKMKMSHQEVRQEHKESDGNPQMKGKMRQRQRDIAQGNSVGAVPKADFVLMNPTHFAVAIKYDEKTMRAPRVISKGADLLAFKIRDIAKNNSIPVLQSPMLARALYANAEIDQDIPSSLYTAVAQVLAYVYRLRSAMRGDGPMPGDPPVPFVPPELDPQSKVVANSTGLTS